MKTGTKATGVEIFFGREAEQAAFQQLFRKATASLVVCCGRRRIGKSTLIRKCAAQAQNFLAFEGLAPHAGLSNEQQLAFFARKLAEQTRLPELPLTNWPQAFQTLASALPRAGWTVVLFDEISWMARYEKNFPGFLKEAWDNWFKPHGKLILVLCGSVSSWIEDNILHNTGFVGRPSLRLTLEPLSLPECDGFWGRQRQRISPLDKLKVLSVTGGVPRYLEEIDPTLSAEENIHRLCYRKEGFLFNEFEGIVGDIFEKRAPEYRELLQTLVAGGKSVSQISDALGRSRSGHLSRQLHELELAGFIRRDAVFDPANGLEKRMELFRLSDNYLRFYLKYVEPERRAIEKGLYKDRPLETLPEWDTIMGLQFENLVLNNLARLRPILGLAATPILAAAPFYQKKTARKESCQVDLLLRTKNALYVAEMKCRRSITSTVMEEVREKIRRLKPPRNLSLRTALVYEGQLAPEIEIEGYFDFLIPFARLMGEAYDVK